MSAAYDKWFNEEMDLKDPWEVTLEKAFEAGVKVGASAERFEPVEDHYDPKRDDLLMLSGKIAVAFIEAPGRAADPVKLVRDGAAHVVGAAAAIIAEVDRVSGVKP